MAALFSLLFMTLLGVVVGTIHDVQLVGRIQPDCQAGDLSCPRENPTGINVTIWHGDNTCSVLYLHCSPDRFRLTLDSPAQLTQSSFCALGQPEARRAGCCRVYQSGPPDPPQPKIETPHKTKHQFYYTQDIDSNSCGTEATEVTGAFGTNHMQYTNKVEIIEFLEQNTGGLRPPISLISHTHVNIKCCLGDPPCITDCDGGDPHPEPPPISVDLLQRCTEKQFTFTCTSNVVDERYHCYVTLKDGETLQTQDVGYTLDTCTARPAGGGVGAPVVIYQAGIGADHSLLTTLGVCGNSAGGDPVDERIYSLEGPWIQWETDSCQLHPVELDCTVKVVSKAELPALTQDSPDVCKGESTGPRLDAGFFQAGKLTVV